MLPTEYVSSTNERMNLYKELDNIKNRSGIGKIQSQTYRSFRPVAIGNRRVASIDTSSKKAANLYFEKIVLKKGSFTGYFIANRESPFYQSPLFEKILRFLQQNHPHVQLKENNKKLLLTIRKIPTIKAAMHWLIKLKLMNDEKLYALSNPRPIFCNFFSALKSETILSNKPLINKPLLAEL
jgi:transcription-repair coupling factor (superfamily II helicase)